MSEILKREKKTKKGDAPIICTKKTKGYSKRTMNLFRWGAIITTLGGYLALGLVFHDGLMYRHIYMAHITKF